MRCTPIANEMVTRQRNGDNRWQGLRHDCDCQGDPEDQHLQQWLAAEHTGADNRRHDDNCC